MPDPFNITYDPSLSGQQETWIKDALARSRFPIDRGAANITFKVVVEPSAPGHRDYMATIGAGLNYDIEIRVGADDPTAAFNQWLPDPARDIKRFFQESIIHEIGHVFYFAHFNTDAAKTELASWFRHRTTKAAGSFADFNPLDQPWEDRIQEGVAEFFKDVYLPDQQRVFDNRSRWDFDEARFDAWFDRIEEIICPGDIIIS